MTLSPILTVKDLVISTSNESKKLTLVDNLSFELLPSEILSIVGESGSGKSITAKSILGLLNILNKLFMPCPKLLSVCPKPERRH